MSPFQIMITRLESASETLEDREYTGEQEAVDKAINILQTLERWCDAYPEDIFTKPTAEDWKGFNAALRLQNLTGDKFAADCMRHVTEGFKKVLHDV